jgi:hypothetical protein
LSPRKPRLVPAAELRERALADEAWAVLMDEGVPATLEHTPRSFGQGGYTRVFVPEANLETAQRLIEPIVMRDNPA